MFKLTDFIFNKKLIIMNYYEYIDEFDNPVKKPKNKFPYSYDGFILHRFGPNSEADSTVLL